MWYSDAPTAQATLGSDANWPLAYAADPNDGAHVWAISRLRLAWQQVAHREEFEIMPDALLQDAGYRLGTVAGVALPDSLTSVIERGPDVLNSRTHPMSPSLLTISGRKVFAACRTFDNLDVHTALVEELWLCAICPGGTWPVLLADQART